MPTKELRNREDSQGRSVCGPRAIVFSIFTATLLFFCPIRPSNITTEPQRTCTGAPWVVFKIMRWPDRKATYPDNSIVCFIEHNREFHLGRPKLLGQVGFPD